VPIVIDEQRFIEGVATQLPNAARAGGDEERVEQLRAPRDAATTIAPTIVGLSNAFELWATAEAYVRLHREMLDVPPARCEA
jgi:hypothetical protein